MPQVISCGAPRCKTEYGPVVGRWVAITVGQNNYVFDGVFAVQCEGCHHVKGAIPTLTGVAQDVRCPNPACGRKCGEIFPGGVVVSSGGRTVWALRIERVMCRCGHDWEPRYVEAAAPAFVTMRTERPETPERRTPGPAAMSGGDRLAVSRGTAGASRRPEQRGALAAA